jgi:GT2 family glycosyltransferase
MKPSVCIATLITKERGGWIHPGLSAFLSHAAVLNATGKRVVKFSQPDSYIPHDHARNRAAHYFMESGCEWLLMIDNDVVPKSDLFALIDSTDDRMDIIVPKTFHLMPNQLTLGWKFIPGASTTPHVSGWVELEAAATTCLAIRRKTFEKMAKPYFRFEYDANGFLAVGEDIGFCRKARAAGLRIWGNDRFACDHYHTVSLNSIAALMGQIKR